MPSFTREVSVLLYFFNVLPNTGSVRYDVIRRTFSHRSRASRPRSVFPSLILLFCVSTFFLFALGRHPLHSSIVIFHPSCPSVRLCVGSSRVISSSVHRHFVSSPRVAASRSCHPRFSVSGRGHWRLALVRLQKRCSEPGLP